MKAVAALALLLLAGCLGTAVNDKADGHFVNYRWGTSTQQCNNGACTYGSNHQTYTIQLACAAQPTLSWDANSWVHGSVVARVQDGAGAQVASHTVAGNGKGSQPVAGTPGSWTLEGSTQDANGNMEVRLTCGS
ncbi:MAG: hypothetical protein QOI63_1370 [Thermoplasmata archaeon]|jgi:hypothetical protein|nr:hypothetical protein [Thermoplasmata archaeon]